MNALQPPRRVPAGIGNAYYDDSQIRHAVADVYYGEDDERTEIEVYTLEGRD